MEVKRELKSLNNKTGEKIKMEIKNVLYLHEKWKGCYFWTPRGNAAARRSVEFNREISFILSGVKYQISQGLTASCKNYYYGLDIRKNGNKSNITALTKLI